MSQLVRKSEPNKLTYVGELLGGRSFSPKMVSFPKTLILIFVIYILSLICFVICFARMYFSE
jgi:hypothetical protein